MIEVTVGYSAKMLISLSEIVYIREYTGPKDFSTIILLKHGETVYTGIPYAKVKEQVFNKEG